MIYFDLTANILVYERNMRLFHKGTKIRQAIHLSTLLFNNVMGVLAIEIRQDQAFGA